MEGNEMNKATTEEIGGGSLLEEIEQKKSELAQLIEDIENKKAELAALSDKVESIKPAAEKDILDDVEDVKIVYKSFSLDGKKYDREVLAAALNQGDEDAYAVIRKLATLKSGAIELIKTKE